MRVRETASKMGQIRPCDFYFVIYSKSVNLSRGAEEGRLVPSRLFPWPQDECCSGGGLGLQCWSQWSSLECSWLYLTVLSLLSCISRLCESSELGIPKSLPWSWKDSEQVPSPLQSSVSASANEVAELARLAGPTHVWISDTSKSERNRVWRRHGTET